MEMAVLLSHGYHDGGPPGRIDTHECEQYGNVCQVYHNGACVKPGIDEQSECQGHREVEGYGQETDKACREVHQAR
jgi:hypothetical protein